MICSPFKRPRDTFLLASSSVLARYNVPKPRLNDQTFSSNVGLEDVSPFSRLSQLHIGVSCFTHQFASRADVLSFSHQFQQNMSELEPETEFRWQRGIFPTVSRKKHYVDSLFPMFGLFDHQTFTLTKSVLNENVWSFSASEALPLILSQIWAKNADILMRTSLTFKSLLTKTRLTTSKHKVAVFKIQSRLLI